MARAVAITSRSRDSLAAEPIEDLLQLLLARRLGLDPVADHLLLGAHVLDEALDALGEVRHRLRRGASAGALVDRRGELVQRQDQVGGWAVPGGKLGAAGVGRG